MSSQDFNDLLTAFYADFAEERHAEVLQKAKHLLTYPEMMLAEPFYFDLHLFLKTAVSATEDLTWAQSPRYGIWLCCAHSAHVLGDLTLAIDYLEQLKAQQRNPVLWHIHGRWLYDAGDLEGALKLWQQALQIDPTYLPAYEDAITLANAARAPEQAFRLIQWASDYRMTPRLLEEMLLASSKAEYVSMRSLFVELCTSHIDEPTRAPLVQLLQSLYGQEDYHHSAYLGFHLLLVFPEDETIRALYVFSALYQKQYAQCLKLLLDLPKTVHNAGYFYQLAQVFEQWDMSLFAREFFIKALQHAEDSPETQEAIKTTYYQIRSQGLSEGEKLKAFIKRMGVDQAFKQRFRRDFEKTLQQYHIVPGPAWERLRQIM